MAKRLSDTKSVVGAFGGDVPATNSYTSKSVRKIANGYVTRTCTDGVEHEEYSATPAPVGNPHGPGENKNSLSDAMEYLKGRKV